MSGGLRALVKSAVELALARGGPAGVGRAMRRDQALVLTYHNIIEDDAPAEGDRSLHLRRRDFAEQLDLLVRHMEVVPLASLFPGDGARPSGGGGGGSGSGRPRVAITLDDAYRGALTAGAEEMGRRALPATIFVAPGFLGSRVFWWDAIAGRQGAGVPDAVRDRALNEQRGRHDDVRAWAEREGLPWSEEVSNAARTVTEGELDDVLRRYPNLTVGSHSWSHPNFARLTDAEAAEELERPAAWLRARCGERYIGCISYPYGSYGPATPRLAAGAGYRAGLSQTSGWIGAGGTAADPADRYRAPRLNIPAGVSALGFEARISGLLAG